MRYFRLLIMTLVASLAGCFVTHPKLIGVAEKLVSHQFDGYYYVSKAPLDDKQIGVFYVTEVDSAQGIFLLEDYDEKIAGKSEKMEVHVRRVSNQLFLNVRYQAKNPYRTDNPWMLFVVEEATPDKIVLAWKPAAKPFEAAIERGDFRVEGKLYAGGRGIIFINEVPEINFAEITEKQAEYLAKNWRELFTPERITLERAIPD